MKSKKELNAQKEEVETVSKKLNELTDEELAQVSGGQDEPYDETVLEPYPSMTFWWGGHDPA